MIECVKIENKQKRGQKVDLRRHVNQRLQLTITYKYKHPRKEYIQRNTSGHCCKFAMVRTGAMANPSRADIAYRYNPAFHMECGRSTGRTPPRVDARSPS